MGRERSKDTTVQLRWGEHALFSGVDSPGKDYGPWDIIWPFSNRLRENQAMRVVSEHRGRKLKLFREQSGFWLVWIQSASRNKGKIHYPGYRSERATRLFAESVIDAELEEARPKGGQRTNSRRWPVDFFEFLSLFCRNPLVPNDGAGGPKSRQREQSNPGALFKLINNGHANPR